MTLLTWSPSRFGGTTDLGTPANWTPASVPATPPTAIDTLFFNSSLGGTLTGTGTGLNANFSGVGIWTLQGALLTLAGGPGEPVALQDSGKLTINGGTALISTAMATRLEPCRPM